MIKKINNKFFNIIFSLAVELTKIFKFSYIIGSKTAFFSAAQAIAPSIGFFSNTTSNIAVFAIRTYITFFVTGLGFLTSLFYHVPTFFGALYLSTNSKIIKILIPTLSIILFISHPVGNQAFLYSSYWIIPIAIALFNFNSIFMQALGSTFTAHAVGSVIWLYTRQLNPLIWNGLISVVWAERLLFAATMTAAYYAISFTISILKTKIKSYKHSHEVRKTLLLK